MICLELKVSSTIKPLITPKISSLKRDLLKYPIKYQGYPVIDPPGVRGVITPSSEARRVSDGVKNIGFFGEICCSRSIFARVFKL